VNGLRVCGCSHGSDGRPTLVDGLQAAGRYHIHIAPVPCIGHSYPHMSTAHLHTASPEVANSNRRFLDSKPPHHTTPHSSPRTHPANVKHHTASTSLLASPWMLGTRLAPLIARSPWSLCCRRRASFFQALSVALRHLYTIDEQRQRSIARKASRDDSTDPLDPPRATAGNI
jgi:hypothetical protein